MVEQKRMRPVTGFVALAFCAGLGGLVACSSNSEATGANSGAATAGDAAIGCAGDLGTVPFALNLTRKGQNGLLSFVIAGANFNPPAIDNNTWTMKVLDATGAPVKDAVLTFPARSNPSDPWMPDHGHGGPAAKAVNNGDGTYSISPLYFFMGGVWSTYVSAQVGSTADNATFTFCVGS